MIKYLIGVELTMKYHLGPKSQSKFVVILGQVAVAVVDNYINSTTTRCSLVCQAQHYSRTLT